MNLKITTKALDAIETTHSGAAVKWRHESDTFGEHSASAQKAWTVTSHHYNSLVAIRDPMDEAIEAALAAVNGNATAWTITEARGVRDVARAAERMLADVNLSQAERKGARVVYIPNGPSANSYKYAAATTRLTMHRVADGWRLVGVERAEVYPKQAERLEITVSAETAEIIKARAVAPFRIDGAA